MPSSPTGLVARAVAGIQHAAPLCAAAVADSLGPLALALIIDGERVVLTAPAGHLTVSPEAPANARVVEVVARGATVLGLIHGDDVLLPAILANRLRVRAHRADAARLFDVVRYFVDGCARSPDAPALLDELGQYVAAQERS